MWRNKPSTSRPRPLSGWRVLGSLLWKLALAAVLVYGALQLFVRTNYFRLRVEAELSRMTGMEMRVGRIRATESLNLKLRDVISVSNDAGLEARTVRIRWRFFRPEGVSMLESLRIDGLALTFAPDENGVIQPAFLGRMSRMILESSGGGLKDIQSEATLPETPEKTDADTSKASPWMSGPVEIRWASARWQDAAGNMLASASGMEVAWMSMALPNGGQVSHVDCRAGEVKLANGARITGLHVELIDAGDRQFLVNLEASDWGTIPPPRSPETEFRELMDAMD